MIVKIKQIANTENFNQMLGSMGVNVDQNWDIPTLNTEVVNKAEAGDSTSVYKLINIARHSEQEDIKAYALQELVRMGYAEVVEEESDEPVVEETPVESEEVEEDAE